MTINKKDVHRTGALASILNQSDVPSVEFSSQHKEKSQLYLSTNNIESKDTVILKLDTSECKPWDFSDRLDLEMGNIDELASSIQQAGQQEPILVRPIKNRSTLKESPIKYEIIFGNRRWRACKVIGMNVLAIVRNINDQEAARAQKEENENRENISDYSKAIHYKKLIESGVFSNENQLAIKLNIPRNRLNDLMSYTRIPADLICAIKNVHCLSQRLAIKLASMAKNPSLLKQLIQIAPQISEGKISSTNIDRVIKQLELGNSKDPLRRNTPVIGRGGTELFTVREDTNGAPCIIIHKAARQSINLKELEMLIKNYIDECMGKIKK